MPSNPIHLLMAIEDFQAARQRAGMEELLARIAGRSNELLSYEDVAAKLKLSARSDAGNQSIPINAIVGSVGRYADFTRSFLPRKLEDRERWARVKAEFLASGNSMPPIEVYKVGDAYFVLDGNHRVSVARREGFEFIEAHVIEVRTDVPVGPDIRAEDLIIKAEYAEFLAATGIMDVRPNVDLTVTACGGYEKLMEQIRVRQYLMKEAGQTDATLRDAAANWYDETYIPLAEAIRDRGLLHWFPNRTIADLYLWISENIAALEEELGWSIQSEAALTDVLTRRRSRASSKPSAPGDWRKSRVIGRYTQSLFQDILVPLSGDVESWAALEQAIILARQENARLHGLHIVDSIEKSQASGALEVQARFDQACKEADIEGTLAIDVGEIVSKICERAVWTDLIVTKIAHPPLGGLSSLASSFRALILKSSRPILAVPGTASLMKRAVVAFDGSPRSREALFVATYLAEMWKTELTVFSMLEGSRVKADVQDYVRRYLEIHEVEADYLLVESGSMDTLLQVARERDIDVVLMGGYGRSVVRQIVLGSSLNAVLRDSSIPTFICR